MDIDVGPIFRAMLRHKVKFTLIIVEIALTLAIMANSASMILQARRDLQHPSGFDDDNLVAVVGRPLERRAIDEKMLEETNRMYHEDRDVLRAIPGVRALMNTYLVPWWGSRGVSSGYTRVEGGSGELFPMQRYPTDEGLLDTLGISLVEGRMFTAEEVEESTKRIFASDMSPRRPDGSLEMPFDVDVLVSEVFARHALGERPWVGKSLIEPDGSRYHVIGVIDRFYRPYLNKHNSVTEHAFFYPCRTSSFLSSARFLVRVEPGRAAEVARAIPHRLQLAGQPREIRALLISEVRHTFLGPKRLVAGSMAVVNVLLVLVTAFGVAGLTSFSVTERTRQIGTRRALGATAGGIVRYFLIETSLITSAGLAFGAVLAVGLNVAVVSLVEGQAKLDFNFLALSIVLLWFVGLASAISPAMRGARISPAVATRNI